MDICFDGICTVCAAIIFVLALTVLALFDNEICRMYYNAVLGDNDTFVISDKGGW